MLRRARFPRKRLSAKQRAIVDFYEWLKRKIARDALWYGETFSARDAVWLLPDGRLANGRVSEHASGREVDHSEYPHDEELAKVLDYIRVKNGVKGSITDLMCMMGNLIRFSFTRDGDLHLAFYSPPTQQQINVLRDIVNAEDVRNVYVDVYTLIPDGKGGKTFEKVYSDELLPDELPLILPKLKRYYQSQD